jgi:integration host factor subunit alpha
MPKSTETRGTLTRAALAKVAYARCSTLSRAEAQEILEVILEEVREALANGEPVKLRSFGTFKIRAKRERPGRNPRTGDDAPISPMEGRDIQGFASPHYANERRRCISIGRLVDLLSALREHLYVVDPL